MHGATWTRTHAAGAWVRARITVRPTSRSGGEEESGDPERGLDKAVFIRAGASADRIHTPVACHMTPPRWRQMVGPRPGHASGELRHGVSARERRAHPAGRSPDGGRCDPWVGGLGGDERDAAYVQIQSSI
eukprot:1810697-Prymnesium_polylepis.2